MFHHATMTHHTQVPQPILLHTSGGRAIAPRKYIKYGKFIKSVEPTKIPYSACGSELDTRPFTSTHKYRKTGFVVCEVVDPRVQFQRLSDIAGEQEDFSPVNQPTQQREDDWEMIPHHSDCAVDDYDEASGEQESSLVEQNTVESAGEATIKEQGAQDGRRTITRVIGKYFCL